MHRAASWRRAARIALVAATVLVPLSAVGRTALAASSSQPAHSVTAHDFTVQGAAATGAPLQRIAGTYSPLPMTLDTRKASSGPATAARPRAAAWTSITSPPTAIMDNAAATDPATGGVYSVGGYDGTKVTAAAYVYDPAARTWRALPPMADARESPQATFIGRKLYVFGGWDANTRAIAATEVYDPASGVWSAAASDPVPVGAGALASLHGKVYIVGGCSVNFCGQVSVEVYDPAANTWSAAASYPQPISWEGCAGIRSRIYCAGGSTGSISDTASAYAYNPASGSWSPIAPIPIDLWGMGFTAAGGKLLLSGGVTNTIYDATNQGFAYDPRANAWSDLPNSNNADFRGGSACGFYRIGGGVYANADVVLPQDVAEQLPGYGGCG